VCDGAHRRTTLVAAEAEIPPARAPPGGGDGTGGEELRPYCSLKVAAMSLTAGARFKSDEAAICTVTSR
jgi:hypothetical protein